MYEKQFYHEMSSAMPVLDNNEVSPKLTVLKKNKFCFTIQFQLNGRAQINQGPVKG